MRKILIILSFICLQITVYATTVVTIKDAATWRNTEMSKYVGQTIQFDTPFYICNNYNGSLTISPRRIFQATNQAIPLSNEYNSILSLNSVGTITLSGVSGYHRMGEKLCNLVVKVNSKTSVTLVSCDFIGNTRAELEQGYDKKAVNQRGEATIVVCVMNLEYYLVENLGTGYGPDNYNEHQKQRKKISQALAKINADIYGFVEIEQGQSALAELAADLTTNTGRNYSYINDGGSTNGSYTKAGYVYCSDKVKPYGGLRNNNQEVSNRKKTQAFVEIASGEKFLLSLNHFKAKSGKGYGDNADQNDGQGQFNGDRVREAQSVLSNYAIDKSYYGDEDILIMGDLNAYAMEDPITVLKEGGMIDLHRAFHADSSYSYTYHGYAGYLDHALCNKSLYAQVTGMVAYHINSDESDNYTYDKSNDGTMFRCSDHDPVIVGLRLDSNAISVPELIFNEINIRYIEGVPYLCNGEGGWYQIYALDGTLRSNGLKKIASREEPLENLPSGLYIVNTYSEGKCKNIKIVIP